MSDATKKQNFLQGAALLALATAIVKVIGALYKLPMNETIGAMGYTYFSAAYRVYTVLLMISSAGLPVAMSRMISQASALGHYSQVRRIYKTSRAIFVGLGLASTALMVFGCHWLAQLLNRPNAWAAILCLGPSALLMGLMSTYRGFFQGQGDMRPTSVSQVLEAVFKLVIGLSAAVAIMHFLGDRALAAGGAILGVTLSCLVSVIYLRAKIRPAFRQMPVTAEKVSGYGQIVKELLAVAVPITIGAAGLQILTLAESGLYMGRLVDLVESGQYMSHMLAPDFTAQDTAETVAGVYDMVDTIFNMPCSFIVPITMSVLPAVTEKLTLKLDEEVKQTEESAARVTGLLSLPCSIGLMVLAMPVIRLLGGSDVAKMPQTSALLMGIMGGCVFLYAIIQYTNVLLQTHGYAHVPVIHMLICGGAKLLVVYLLVGNPKIGILGAPIGAVAGYSCIAVLNLLAIRKLVPQKPALLKNLLRPLLSAVIMGLAVLACYLGLDLLIGGSDSRLMAAVLCFVPIAVGVVVYFVGVVVFKAITKEDCQLLPKGDRIAKLLRL